MYIGPETLMPLASVLTAVAGVLLLFWRRTVTIARMSTRAIHKVLSRLWRRP